jgi:RHS repeat-associated protein
VRDVTDTSGTVLDHIEYTSVGAISSETGSTLGGNYGFDGLYVSRNAAINFSLHRQFSTSADAWMQMDPSGFAAGDSNLYRSNGNDPTNATDPSGLQYVKPENRGGSKQGSKELAAQLLLIMFDNWRASAGRFGTKPSDLDRDWKDFAAELRQVLATPPIVAPGGSSISGTTPDEAEASRQRLAQGQKDQEDKIKNDAFWARTRLIVSGSMPANWLAIEQADKINQRERQDLWNKLSDPQQAFAQALQVLLIELATLGLGEILGLGAEAGGEGVQANKLAGDAVRDAIAAREAPALTEQSMTTVGGVRRIDVLKLGDETVGIESKVGRTALDSRVRQELARDWWLRRQGQLDRVQWEFSPSEVTGRVGPTKQLLEKLRKLDFDIRINP